MEQRLWEKVISEPVEEKFLEGQPVKPGKRKERKKRKKVKPKHA